MYSNFNYFSTLKHDKISELKKVLQAKFQFEFIEHTIGCLVVGIKPTVRLWDPVPQEECPLQGVFLRDANRYLSEFRRKLRKIHNG